MKLDNTKISAMDTAGSTAYSNLETQLYNVEKTLTVLTKSLNFKGTGAEQYKSFMQENSVNTTYVLLQVGKDVKEYIEKIKKGFLEFESDESGKVSSSRVDDVKKSLGTISKAVNSDIDDLTSNEEKAAEYISISPTNTNKLTDGFATLNTNLETVNKDFKTKDDELSKGAESILTSISKLDTMITNILNNYVTSSGKYNDAKFKELKQEEWYIQGNGSILDNKRKEDPFIYDTAYFSVGNWQVAKGWDKDYYGYTDFNFLNGKYERKVSDGQDSLHLDGNVLSNKTEFKAGDYFNIVSDSKLLYAEADATSGKNGFKAKVQAGVGETNLHAGALDDNIFFEAKAAGPEAKAEVAFYSDEEESKVGFDFSAKGAKASTEVGFKLFQNEYTEAKDPLFAANVGVEANEGFSAAAMASTKKQYDSLLGQEWIDVHTVNVKVDLSLFLGGKVDVTLPYLTLDF
jgi:protein with prophage function domain